ncbi:MAG: type 1 glutamine amidotransferase [Thermoguttaceae bacterium]
MRAHYLQHVPFEGLGSIGPWLETAGHPVTGSRLFQSAELPDLADFDLLVILGGPMSVNDESKCPWLVAEKQLVRRAIEARKAVLGVCLGAQMIAASLGARVYPNSKKEIGWFPIEGLPVPGPSTFAFPPALKAFHWHGETFDLPDGAVRLARSAACENQAFQVGNSVIGLQFHLETTPDSARQIVANCREELTPSQYVQRDEEVLSATPGDYGAINTEMSRVVSLLGHSES